MTKNYMADVAKMLGVELEEEFKIEGGKSFYVLNEAGLYRRFPQENFIRASGLTLVSILQGRVSIIKLNKEGGNNATN